LFVAGLWGYAPSVTTQHELALELLAIRDQALKIEREVTGLANQARVLFDVSWTLTPMFGVRVQ